MQHRLLYFGLVGLQAISFGILYPTATGAELRTQHSTAPANRVDVQIRLNRLYPPTISVLEGPCRIVFTNAAYTSSLDLLLRDAGGQTIAQTNSEGKLQHRQNITATLTPGTYQLQVAGHPAWTATLTVTFK
jgi:hypothetical protein